MHNLPKKVRSKKSNTRVDLTAMVSVSFLLIVFFMVTIELAKPKAVDLSLSDYGDCHGSIRCYKADRFYTLLLGEDDRLISYAGLLSYPLEDPKEVKYGKNGIRQELLNINKKILAYSASIGKPDRGVYVIIKPSKKCNYKNLIDILDEMRITGITNYSINDYYTKEESNLLALK
ncbi:ExbD/TolR family protein [Flavobacterium sp. FlaQc-48]|uniref:ExbD/TolR family protein n=1 Tax=Flavobacterium sp. FlaQc-48 TaxID=3374181 RepID=UPI0037574A2E